LAADGLVVHGRLEPVTDHSLPILASFVVLPGRTGLTRIFHAGESWSPGGHLVGCAWDFGDGVTAELGGADLRFVIEHTYPAPGSYQVRLTITDDKGATATRSAELSVGTLTVVAVSRLRIRRIRGRDGEPRRLSQVQLAVFDNGAPVPDADVHVDDPAGVSGRTDADGRVWVQAATAEPEDTLPAVVVARAGYDDATWHADRSAFEP
jgi:hypothetical protein